MSLEITLLCIFIFLLLEGFFSGAEIAIVSANKSRLKAQAESGSRGAQLALWFINHPSRFFGTTILGTNLFVVMSSSLLTIFIITHYGQQYDPYALLLSPFVLIIGELFPKSIYQHYADRFAVATSRILFAFYVIFYPIVLFFSYLTKMLLGRVRVGEARGDSVTREELAGLLSANIHPSSDVRVSEQEMINNILHLSNQKVENIMLPLVDIESAPISITKDEAIEMFDLHGHSKMPLFERRIHNIVGILYLMDVLAAQPEQAVRAIVRAPVYVPASMKLHALFRMMRKQDVEIVIVVDEYGGTIGLVTLEMILEEVVGDIQDEFELDEQQFHQVNSFHYIVRGRMEIEEVRDKMNVPIPAGDYETIAGYLLHRFGHIPKSGESILLDGWQFIIRVATPRAILEIEVKKEGTKPLND